MVEFLSSGKHLLPDDKCMYYISSKAYRDVWSSNNKLSKKIVNIHQLLSIEVIISSLSSYMVVMSSEGQLRVSIHEHLPTNKNIYVVFIDDSLDIQYVAPYQDWSIDHAHAYKYVELIEEKEWINRDLMEKIV